MTSNATSAIDPRLWLQPSGVKQGAPGGPYYWSFLSDADQTKLTAFEQANPSLKAVRTEGAFILFQNVGTSPVLWGLSGYPSVAPKGPTTTSADVESMPPPEPGIFDGGGLVDSILKAESTAGKVLLYGGVAVVLFVLYQQLSAKKEPKKEDEKEPSILHRLPVHESDDSDRTPRRRPNSTLPSFR